MLLRVEPSSGVPIWQQIVGQVSRQAMSGALPAGERLPTVRELAIELRVNPNTVARAYQELERAGVVETRRGAGTFACNGAGAERIDPLERRRILAERIDALLVEAAHLQLDLGVVQQVLKERAASMASPSAAADGNTPHLDGNPGTGVESR